MITVDLSLISDYYPWGRMYADLGYAMPYPEVIMTSDRAYALQTQIFGLLMMQSWGSGNKAGYILEETQTTHKAYIVEVEVSLETVDEAWAVVGITEDMLCTYMTEALLNYIQAQILNITTQDYKQVPLGNSRYMFVAN